MKFKIFEKKKIFTQNEIENLRNYFEEQNFFDKSIGIGQLKEMALLSKFMFSERLISYFENYFKDKIYFMDKFVIQKNNRTLKKVKYHKDSGKIHQSRILSNSSNIYGKIGIPLQNNIKGQGGGIDYLVPLPFDNFSDDNKLQNKLRAFYYMLQEFFTDTHFYSKIGDVFFFSAMLSHRTSYTEEKFLKSIKNKYVIYYQLMNLNTIKETLQISRKMDKKIKTEEVEKDIIIYKFNNLNIRVLNQKISIELGNYLGQ